MHMVVGAATLKQVSCRGWTGCGGPEVSECGAHGAALLPPHLTLWPCHREQQDGMGGQVAAQALRVYFGCRTYVRCMCKNMLGFIFRRGLIFRGKGI